MLARIDVGPFMISCCCCCCCFGDISPGDIRLLTFEFVGDTQFVIELLLLFVVLAMEVSNMWPLSGAADDVILCALEFGNVDDANEDAGNCCGMDDDKDVIAGAVVAVVKLIEDETVFDTGASCC